MIDMKNNGGEGGFRTVLQPVDYKIYLSCCFSRPTFYPTQNSEIRSIKKPSHTRIISKMLP
jgi:hypothetical protein